MGGKGSGRRPEAPPLNTGIASIGAEALILPNYSAVKYQVAKDLFPLSTANGGTGVTGSAMTANGIVYVNMTNTGYASDPTFYFDTATKKVIANNAHLVQQLTVDGQTFLNARTEIAVDNATYALTISQMNTGGSGVQLYTAAVQDDNQLAINVLDGNLNPIIATTSSGFTTITCTVTESSTPCLKLVKDNAGLDTDNIISVGRAILQLHNPNNSAQGFMAFTYGDSQTVIGGLRYDTAANLNWHAGTVSSVGRHLFWTAAGTAISGGPHNQRLGIEDGGVIIMPASAGDSPIANLDIGASTTAKAHLQLRSGSAPSSPNDGDIWFDGSALKIRISGTTKTFVLI